MPAQLTYPGVYIEEIPSGVHTITGVSTSDTAFIDFFPRGPVDEAVRITSLGDFERIYGGLDPRSEASYAIQQYFLNGGSVAWVVRVAAGNNVRAAELTLTGGSPAQDTLTVKAASPGVWANNVQVAVDYKTSAPNDTFNLAVREIAIVRGSQQVVASEAYRNLSMSKTSPRYAIDVVNAASSLITLADVGLGARPAATGVDVIGNPQNGEFKALAGSANDGDIPGSNAWMTTSGATALKGSASAKSGLYALEGIAPFIFNILCIPAASSLDDNSIKSLIPAAQQFCLEKRAFFIVDIPATVTTPSAMVQWMLDHDIDHTNSAVYFPRIKMPDPLNENRPRDSAPSGSIAGVYARTDATRGVWKAPAGTEADLRGAELVVKITDGENGSLNPLGINALRNFPIFGNVVWGARTLDGADIAASEWKYIPVRRMALFIEESLFQGSKWIVFEPNDEPLWAQIRLNFGAFMHNLFRQGAFQGTSPKDAYFVKCDKETTTQNDINNGVVNILVGFAPLKPAEFVVIKIQQMAGQIEV